MPLTIDLTVEHGAWAETAGDLEALAGRAVQAALHTARLDQAHEDDQARGDGEVSLVLCDDAFIRTLNRQWRGLDKPTNVLSFPAVPAVRHVSLGDIVVAYETSAGEARERGVSLADHLAHLLIHGVFHLLGHDHGDDREAERMEGLEARALASLGLASPFEVVGEDTPSDERAPGDERGRHATP